jgi:hypothetical protein
MTPQQIKAHDALPEAVQLAYSSLAAAQLNKELVTVLGISEPQSGDFIDHRGDFVLGLVAESNFKDWLRTELNLQPKQIELVIHKTKEHMQGVKPDETPVSPEERTAVEPMHTMASDIEKVHGYGVTEKTDIEPPTEAAPAAEPVYTSEQRTVLTPPPAAPTPVYTMETVTPEQPAAPAAEPASPQPAKASNPPAAAPKPGAPAPKPAATPAAKPEPVADTRWSATITPDTPGQASPDMK